MDTSTELTNKESPKENFGRDEHEYSKGHNRPLVFVLVVFFCFILAYIINFQSHAISGDPGDWGALGDYIGGIINPLISTIALIYLAKAYYTQKTELAETRIALRDTAKHSESSARAQAKLVDSAIKQEILTKRNLELKLLATQISLHQSKISFLHNELSNSTYNYNKFKSTIDVFNTRSQNWITGRSEMDGYRFGLISLIAKEEVEVKGLNEKVKQILGPEASSENH
ncbi:hypothetical protein [Pseudomonas canadensis]|uniref:hypothetical protein n=1 Tax=Pseudomonas canadensis TaxID=915099 RepID=UPI003BA03CDE